MATSAACDSGPKLEAKARQAEAEKQPEEAFKLYQRACEKEALTSCLRLGSLHAEGLGTPKNEAEALKLFSRTCDAQLAEGCSGAASLLARTPTDAARARELEDKACTLGHKASCTERAVRIVQTLDVLAATPEQREEYSRALELIQGGCRSGGQRECESLCVASKGSEQDACRGACDKGVASACHLVAQALLKAEKPELKGVQELETKACEGGVAAACLSLARGGLRGWFKGAQPAKALAKRACDAGDCSAACELGDSQACLAESRRLASTLPPNPKAAEAYAATACRRGLLVACAGLNPSAPATEGTEASEDPLELMRAVCGVEPVLERPQGAEKDLLVCPRCPLAFPAGDVGAPTFSGVAMGSFLEPERKEALVALDGCEGYEFSGVTRGTFGRRVLLAHVKGQWKQLRYYPTNSPTLGEATLRLRTREGTDVFLSDEGPGCHMGGCSTVLKLTRLTEKRMEQQVVLSSDYDESRWYWSTPTQSEDGTVRIMLFPKEEEGEHIVEWKWDGAELTTQRVDSSVTKDRGVRSKLPQGSWRAVPSYDELKR
ncbi:tetratricopeptide repeat protein [Hyalangium rubrum]|uniref:Tetratricopeptide repeat protein n=1 Tax=Hyalangium rubrum TaxID=3103134 RepID=A0ABU5HGY3_9BACT|nr:tetratricopeptide repeat protein [Hyalangium sp. s54d21]MDY7232404.1 tetratricopeptide repeat protein [Hyalangium sp. s54d21]